MKRNIFFFKEPGEKENIFIKKFKIKVIQNSHTTPKKSPASITELPFETMVSQNEPEVKKNIATEIYDNIRKYIKSQKISFSVQYINDFGRQCKICI